MNETVIYTIERINFVGKWAEFWFEELKTESEFIFHESSKAYKVWEKLEEALMTDDIYNHGFVGKKIEFEFISPNWEIKRFING